MDPALAKGAFAWCLLEISEALLSHMLIELDHFLELLRSLCHPSMELKLSALAQNIVQDVFFSA
jgi:hypothetical protein